MIKVLQVADAHGGHVEVPMSIIEIGKLVNEYSTALGSQSSIMQESLICIKDMTDRIKEARQKKKISFWQKIKRGIQKVFSMLATGLSTCAFAATSYDPTGLTGTILAAGCTLATSLSSLMRDINQPSMSKSILF